MAMDLSRIFVIGVTSRALFDLTESNQVYQDRGLDAYRDHQRHHEEVPLNPGPGFALVRAILDLNQRSSSPRKAEVVIMSRNSPDTSLRIFNSIDHHKLDITRAVLSGGAPLAPYLRAFNVALFLSADRKDVQGAIDAEVAAGQLYPGPIHPDARIDQIRVAFDADAVIFSEESEQIFKQHGLAAFLAHEKRNARRALPAGPFAKLLQTLSYLQSDAAFKEPPVRIALVTARNSPAHERVIRTLQAWRVRIDEAFFMGGVTKTPILEAFRPHIFFDDQELHCGPASHVCPTALVPYRTGSALAVPTIQIAIKIPTDQT